jgi:hypothetical protein
MEWILQVIDEVDDALAALRHGWLGFHVESGVALAAGLTMVAIAAALAAGTSPGIIGAAAVMLAAGAAWKLHDARLRRRT